MLSQIRSVIISQGRMPTPVSDTDSCTSLLPDGDVAIPIFPPNSVNFIAFEITLTNICRSDRTSIYKSGRFSEISTAS
jgi:hypothetical protein